MKVMKFGGSSVRDAARIQGAAEIIRTASAEGPVVVVLSAMRGVTDALIRAASEAENGDDACHVTVKEIADRHRAAAAELLSGTASGAEPAEREIEASIAELENILHGVELIRECSPRTRDLVMSFGERINCRLIAAYLQSIGVDAYYFDAREAVITDELHGRAEVEFETTNQRIRRAVSAHRGIPVVTGFIGSTAAGVTTTLGRDGSDYTASIFGAALGASVIEIWTDVDGVLSADPRYVAGAFVVPELSYKDAMELSYFGAKVIHPNTMIPAVRAGIPILIKNTFRPDNPGSLIHGDVRVRIADVTGIASIDGVALLNVEGGGMVGVRGMASRVFRALAGASVNVVMISQASSEQSICLVCREGEVESAVGSLEEELAREIASGKVERFQVVRDLEIVALIGERMRGTPGISGMLFSALGNAGINVLAIAQGSSERNISFVVARADARRAINIVHDAFLGGVQ